MRQSSMRGTAQMVCAAGVHCVLAVQRIVSSEQCLILIIAALSTVYRYDVNRCAHPCLGWIKACQLDQRRWKLLYGYVVASQCHPSGLLHS